MTLYRVYGAEGERLESADRILGVERCVYAAHGFSSLPSRGAQCSHNIYTRAEDELDALNRVRVWLERHYG